MKNHNEKQARAAALAAAGLVPASHKIASGDQMFVKRKFVPAMQKRNSIDAKDKTSAERIAFLRDVQRDRGYLTLTEVWTEPSYRKALREYLDRHFCAESVEFLEDAEQFRVIETDVERTQRGKQILSRYFEATAEEPVNIDGNTQAELVKMAKSDNLDKFVFDKAIKLIYDLLENDIFQRFLQSPDYKKLIGEEEKTAPKRQPQLKKKIEEVVISSSDAKYIRSVCTRMNEKELDSHWVLVMPWEPGEQKSMPSGRILVITEGSLFTIMHTLLSRNMGTVYDLFNLADMSAYPGEHHVRLDFYFRSSEPARFSVISHYVTSQKICRSLIEATSGLYAAVPDAPRPLFSVTHTNADSAAENQFRADMHNDIARQRKADNMRRLEMIQQIQDETVSKKAQIQEESIK